MCKCQEEPDLVIDTMEDLRRQMGPALALHEIVRYAAFEWGNKSPAERADCIGSWFDQLPGAEYPWIPDDYMAVGPVAALLLGMIDHFERAFSDLCRAVEAHYEWEIREERAA